MSDFKIEKYLSDSSPASSFELFCEMYHGQIPAPESEGPEVYSFPEIIWLLLSGEMKSMGIGTEMIDSVGRVLWEEYSLSEAVNTIREAPELVENISLPASERKAVSGRLSGPDTVISPEGVITPLEAAIIQCVRLSSPTSILVFPGGEVMIWVEALSATYSEEEKAQIKGQSHFNICFSGIIESFLPQSGPGFASDPIDYLQPDAMQVLQIIQSGKYERVEITLKEGRMKSMGLTRTHKRTANIPRVIAASDFQEVTVKRHRGRTSFIQTTEKIFFE